MYLMYVDESGDTGLVNSPTRLFVLSGLVVHELRWHECLDRLIAFRRRMRDAFGLKLREELHASAMLSRPGELVRIRRDLRLTIIRAFADELAATPHFSLVNVAVDKASKTPDCDLFERAWTALVQRFEDTLNHSNFPAPSNPDERGILLPDNTDGEKLRLLVRRLRRYNPIPHRGDFGPGFRNRPLTAIVEDPVFRRSDHSYFIQAVDCAAFLLYQHLAPSSYVRRKSAQNYFLRLRPILCRSASPRDPEGVVRL